MTTHDILVAAKSACADLASLSAEVKNNAILAMADSLVAHMEQILQANASDMEKAAGTISEVMLDRLRLDRARIEGMAQGMRDVAELPDPVGKVLKRIERPNGLVIEKTSVPLGVVAIIYESRPNVTSDAAVLALKSGNVCVLRSGKEAYNSARAIVDALRAGLGKCGLPKEFINIVDDISRQSSVDLMTADGLVDLLIPRGGAGLIKACTENATVPCIETGTGICHIYVDRSADQDMALRIIENAKTSRPSVCNAAEVCLIHGDIAAEFLPKLSTALCERRQAEGLKPVQLRADEKAMSIIDATPASDKDFDTEFLDYIMAVKVVRDIEEAIGHIARHSTHHSDAIITSDKNSAKLFTDRVDSAAVYVNASTRFTDGGEFGLGCEMGISTQKLHARGPMGLQELTTYKYIIRGDGQTR